MTDPIEDAPRPGLQPPVPAPTTGMVSAPGSPPGRGVAEGLPGPSTTAAPVLTVTSAGAVALIAAFTGQPTPDYPPRPRGYKARHRAR